MTTIHQRIKIARENKGLSQTDLASLINVSPQAVNQWERDDGTTPRQSKINQVAEVLGVSEMWLLYGDRNLAEPPLSSSIEVIENDKDYSSTHIEIDMYDVKLSAGNGNVVWIIREEDEPLYFRKAWFKAKGLSPSTIKGMYVRGDSMIPDLNDKDTVLIDTSDTEISDGETYAICYKGQMYIKIIARDGDGIQLVSRNESYSPITIKFEDAENLQILGRKVWRGG